MFLNHKNSQFVNILSTPAYRWLRKISCVTLIFQFLLNKIKRPLVSSDIDPDLSFADRSGFNYRYTCTPQVKEQLGMLQSTSLRTTTIVKQTRYTKDYHTHYYVAPTTDYHTDYCVSQQVTITTQIIALQVHDEVYLLVLRVHIRVHFIVIKENLRVLSTSTSTI